MIKTQRLIIGKWKEEYKNPFFEINSDKEIMEFFPDVLSREESDAMADRIMNNMERDGYGLYAVTLKETGEFIGFIGLSKPIFEADFTPCVEIGWRLHKKFWKKGYATEGAKAVLNYGFTQLELTEIVSFTAEINKLSIKVMERIGMEKKGYFYHSKIDRESKICKHVLYKITKEHFLKSDS